jgi:hypothetical protein
MTEEGPVFDRYQRRFMSPILDHLARAPADPIGQVHRVISKAGEEGEKVGAGHDIDRVQLDDAHPVNHSPQVTEIDPPARAWLRKTLGGQGNSTSLSDGELAHGDGRVKPTPSNLSLASSSR